MIDDITLRESFHMRRFCQRSFGLLAVGLLCASATQAAETPESLTKKAAAALAQIEGEIKLTGLHEPVEVLRDRWGIAHIYARNTDDLFFAQGFVVAQDRSFQIDTWRRVGLGETAAVIGKEGLVGDRFARLMKYRGDLDAEWNSYAPDARQIAASFTRGINACIDQMGDNLPVEFKLLGYQPAKWQPEDILGRMSGLIMSRNFTAEVGRSTLVRAVGVEKARRIAPTDPPVAFAPAPGLDLADISPALVKDYERATQAIPFESADSGSNNWAVDGTLSESGKPLLAGDPHRSLLLPSLRYLVHLNAPGWNVIGSGEPALPGVAIGHNEHVAWAFTIVNTDQSDFYVEETKPGEPTQYKVDGKWQPMEVVREKVQVRGQAPVEVELRFTRHGPIVHQDDSRHRAFALRWSGSQPGGAAYLPSLRLDRTKNVREFVDSLPAWKIPALNMVFADVAGDIGWVASGATPIRQGWNGLLPVPGDGGFEWQGFLPVAELPQVHNPANHYVATANHNILPSGYKKEISYEWSSPYRYERIHQRLEGQRKFDLDDFQSMQHDMTSLPAKRLIGLLGDVAMKSSSSDLPELDASRVAMLLKWNDELTPESPEAALFILWFEELTAEFYKPHLPDELRTGGPSRSVPTMLAALEKPDAFWFGDSPEAGRNKLLAKTFITALEKARQRFPGYPERGTWGEMHPAEFTHPLSGLGKAYAKAFNLAPVPRGGDGLTPHAASYNRAFRQVSGASYRHVLDLADWDRGLATSTPGQSGQPGSPHYSDLLPLWASSKYFPLAYTRSKVDEVTQHRLRLAPR